MQPIPISEYIKLGIHAHYLESVQKNWPVHIEDRVLDNIDNFLKGIDKFNLKVTKNASIFLVNFRDQLSRTFPDYRLSADEAYKLSAIMESLIGTLLAEALGNKIFSVTEKRYENEKLLNDVSSLMTPGVFDALPDMAQYDFIEAGKCIAFERPTAAAFHLLRGTEAVITHLYFARIEEHDRIENPMWNNMTVALANCNNPPPAALLGNLDNIRKYYRNPTAHPQLIYDIETAQDLLGLCIQAITQIIDCLNH